MEGRQAQRNHESWQVCLASHFGCMSSLHDNDAMEAELAESESHHPEAPGGTMAISVYSIQPIV